MRKNKFIPYEPAARFKLIDIPIGILFTIFFIALGLAIAINLRPLYYLNISWLDLESSSGLNAVVIKENYNALIDYCSPFYTGELSFPSLRSSASAISHFAEVKDIFNIIYIAGAVSLVLCIVAIVLKRRSKEYRYLMVSGVTAVILPVLLCIVSLISFDWLFTVFHKVVFSNDDWIFDPKTDPIIDLLPETYFMQCALVIAFVVIIGVTILLLRYNSYRKHRGEERLLPRKKNYYY